MPSVLLLLVGVGVLLYSLWQLRRWLAEAQGRLAAAPRRLEGIVEELIVTAEGAAAVVAERTEALEGTIARANATLAKLDAAMTGRSRAGELSLRKRVSVPKDRHPRAASASLGSVQATETAPAVPPAPATPEIPELHRRVYALADAGQDLTSIARQLSLTKGEVQFILGLRRMN